MRRIGLLFVGACSQSPSTPPPAPPPPPIRVVPDADTADAVDASIDAPGVAARDDAPVELGVVRSFPGLDVVESINNASHVHGGPPAQLDHVTINIEVRDAQAHAIEVRRVQLVHRNCGRARETKDDARPVKLLGHALYTWDSAAPIATGTTGVTTPAGAPRRLSVRVDHESVTSYRACGYEIDLVVDRVRQQFEVPLHIKRFQPLRR